ncbi:hypothetical protein [Anabaena lutea]|uniref:Uncharacterized protein n=1 Tax=Anabaena lutea FACHB-196 TaxID=2692881 RepID=A0ABR8F8J6_9NOST|nr:hypothetical protein [Anabaena lutea]MBD2566532.1 hypothetical protein [Anabaena lutea FACHB-196]
MKIAFPQEDIQLLASILQEQLLLEVPSGKAFQVRCAVQNDELMVLTQHPPGVTVDTQKIFAVLEEALQWQSQYHGQRVQFYVRVSGEKLPYAKQSLTVKAKEIQSSEEMKGIEASDTLKPSAEANILIFPPPNLPKTPFLGTDDHISENPFSSIQDDHISENPFSSSIQDDHISENPFSSIQDDHISENPFSSIQDDHISENSFSSIQDDHISENSFSSIKNDYILENSFSETPIIDENYLEDEDKFDPFAGGQNLSKSKKLSLPPLPILLGAVLGVTVICGGGAFFLTRSCVIGGCQELQIAKQFQSESPQLMRQAKSEKQLLAVQQQLETTLSSLKVIPQWSPRYQQAQELASSFSEQSGKISLVVKALQAAAAAEQKTQTPANSLEELRARQSLWRQAIAPLESIKSGHELYGLVQGNLPSYQRNLQALNQQLLKEETWLKKLATTKVLADANIQREATAKSGNDWQKVKSDWLKVVNTLKSIPQGSTGHQEAQKLLTEYQPKFNFASDRAKKETDASTIYQRALNIANQAKVQGQKNQWQESVDSWNQALDLANKIPQDSFYYNQAQSLIPPYRTALAQAEEKFQLYGNLTKTRADLNTTCVNGIRFCVFNIENKGIIVRLTPEYDKQLESDNPNIQSHFQALRDALGVVGENAQLPLFIYNSQGQERYMKMPQ